MTPPRLMRALLAVCAAPGDRAPLSSELEDEFTRVAATQSSGAARRWYRQQVRRSARAASGRPRAIGGPASEPGRLDTGAVE